jgi:hypothetical protein
MNTDRANKDKESKVVEAAVVVESASRVKKRVAGSMSRQIQEGKGLVSLALDLWQNVRDTAASM